MLPARRAESLNSPGRGSGRLLVVIVALFCSIARGGAQQDAPATPPAQPTQPATPTFRAGINFVRVDAIVTDNRGNPILTLTRDDFEVLEDGKPQAIEQFKLVDAAGGGERDDLPPQELRTRDDELLDAERDDVRVFAILLDDYHVPKTRSAIVRETLSGFIKNQVRPNDLLTVVYPLTPVRTLTFTRDHESVMRAIRTFDGRKGDYAPRNAVEEQHWRNLPAIERIRADIVVDALSALSIRLGSLREGRKSIILVGDGFSASPLRLRDIFRDANRNNVSIYPFDPCGLTGPAGFSDNGRLDCSGGRFRRDTLLTLADETDGRAIVNRNSVAEGLAQVARDSSYYYLLGYNSSTPANDGKFHEIRVRLKPRGFDVRARRGYWALTAAEVERAASARPVVLTPVQRALADIDIAADAKRLVRTWVGSERGADGKTRVTVAWETQASRDARPAAQPGRLTLTATDGSGVEIFTGGGSIAPGSQALTFDAPPGRLELRVSVEAAGNGETLDRNALSVEVPDLASSTAALSTPRVFAGRTANEFRAVAGNAAAIPTARREFLRTERLLIRFDAYGPGAERPGVTAALVNWTGSRLSDVTVAPAEAGGTHQISLGLGSLAPGDYAVEIVVKNETGEARQLVPIRVGS
jgi:VWFA-related protein